MCSDLDFILFNIKTKRYCCLEQKQYGKKLSKWQLILYHNLGKWIARGIGNDAKWLGFYIVTFRGESFDDGGATLQKINADGELTKGLIINSADFVAFFSMENRELFLKFNRKMISG